MPIFFYLIKVSIFRFIIALSVCNIVNYFFYNKIIEPINIWDASSYSKTITNSVTDIKSGQMNNLEE